MYISTYAPKFGAGFGKDEHLLDCRPCGTTLSAQNHKHFTRRLESDIYTGSSFQDPRPTWWQNHADPVFRIPSPSRLGEWRLVWRPKDCKNDGERSHPQRETIGMSRAASKQSASLPQRANSSQSNRGQEMNIGSVADRLGTEKELLNADVLRQAENRAGVEEKTRCLGSSASRRSRCQSRGSLASTDISDTSTASIRSSEIMSRCFPCCVCSVHVNPHKRSSKECLDQDFSMLTKMSEFMRLKCDENVTADRIQNLEDAIRSEKSLRFKLQAVLELKNKGLGNRSPPNGRLPPL